MHGPQGNTIGMSAGAPQDIWFTHTESRGSEAAQRRVIGPEVHVVLGPGSGILLGGQL